MLRVRSVKSRVGFTLVELLCAITIGFILATLLLASLSRAKMAGSQTLCSQHLKQFGLAAQLYWDDNLGESFPFRARTLSDGEVYWFGWLQKGREGERIFEPKQGLLYAYLGESEAGRCPSFNPTQNGFKLKGRDSITSYGYSLSLAPTISKPWIKIDALKNPSVLTVFADSAQVNTFQFPATLENPLVEEFYYVNASEPTTHFRHVKRANSVFVDGHVGLESMKTGSLDLSLPKQLIGTFISERFELH